MDSFTQEFFFTGSDGREYQIYPMKLKHKDRVARLFGKIDTEFLFLNLPVPKLNNKGEEILNENGEVMMDYEKYDAMIELFHIATRLDKEKIEDVVDLNNGVKILDEFMNISQLKKKIAQGTEQMAQLLNGIGSMQES